MKNCENGSNPVSRQKKNDNALQSEEAQKDMLNDDTNTATNTNNTAMVNGEKAVKKVVKTIERYQKVHCNPKKQNKIK